MSKRNGIKNSEVIFNREGERIANELKKNLLKHLDHIGVNGIDHDQNNLSKPDIRSIHRSHRLQAASREKDIFNRYSDELLAEFADGCEVEVEHIDPVLTEVKSDTREALLFRYATLLWSIPVSRGYGRRIRVLVRDQNNGKLIGIFALGSPVFNLRARDDWIGWNKEDRAERLINVMDAYVVGAVPPYSQLLGSKLVAALMCSDETQRLFKQKYFNREGIITGQVQNARLALLTTTSALGRSSLYNRLKLPDLFEFIKIGETTGWGHFHIPDELFKQMRELLEAYGHRYSGAYKFGDGPNWRIRTVRVALEIVGLDKHLLRHGIRREVYAAPLASNWRRYLKGEVKRISQNQPTASEITRACIHRWTIPRAERRPEYQDWTRQNTLTQILGNFRES